MLGWIPRPVSWLRTIVLIAIATVMAGTLRFFGTYGAYFTYASNHLGFFVFMSMIGLLIPFIGYAYIHSWLIGKKPEGWSKKIPSPSSIKEAVLLFTVLIFGTLATILLLIPFFPPYISRQQTEVFGSIATFVWLLITTYIFHGYNLISREYAKKSVDKSKPESPKNKVDPVDRELTRLKHQTGMMIKQPPKKD
jgi:hypothetical protein